MLSKLGSPQDRPTLLLGVLSIAVAAIGLFMNRNFDMGPPGEIGPGYMPRAVFLCLGALGAINVARSVVGRKQALERWSWRPLIAILAAAVAFALTIKPLGLLLSIFISVLITGFAEPQYRVRATMVTAIGIVIICSVIFVWGLGSQLSLLPVWIG